MRRPQRLKKNLPLVLTKQLFLFSSTKRSGRFFQIVVAFSENLNFNDLLANQYSRSDHKTPKILCAIQQVNHKGPTIFKCCFSFNFKSDTRNNPNNTAIFVDICSWFFFDKRALGIWCNGIVPYKPNEFLMHRAHTITVRTRLTRQHHKHFSYVMLYFYTIGCNPFWRCILNFSIFFYRQSSEI